MATAANCHGRRSGLSNPLSPPRTLRHRGKALTRHPSRQMCAAMRNGARRRMRPESGGIECAYDPTPTLRPPLSSLLLLGLHRIGGSTDEAPGAGAHGLERSSGSRSFDVPVTEQGPLAPPEAAPLFLSRLTRAQNATEQNAWLGRSATADASPPCAHVRPRRIRPWAIPSRLRWAALVSLGCAEVSKAFFK